MPGAVQLRLGRAGRDAQHLRDLLVLVPLHVVEREHPASTGWEACDGLLEIEQVAWREGHSHDAAEPVHPLLLILFLETTTPASFGFAIVETHVDREPVQPRRERRLT